MVTAFLDDIESDFSVFHRVDDALAMPAQRFINLALRLPMYRGALRETVTGIMAEDSELGTTSPRTSNTPPASSRGRDGQTRTVDSSSATLATDPGLGGMIEVRRVPDGGEGL